MKKVPLTWENWACLESCQSPAEGTFEVKSNARGSRVTVSADGRGLVSQAGAVLLWETMRVTGLGRGLSEGLARWRAPRAVHDPGKIVADLAAALALGGDCLADIAVLREQPELAGPVASDPVVSRLVSQLAGDLPRALKAIRAARAAARERAWALAGSAAPGARRRAGHRRPGRHHRDRPLREAAGRPDLEEDLRLPSPGRLRRPRRRRERRTAGHPAPGREAPGRTPPPTTSRPLRRSGSVNVAAMPAGSATPLASSTMYSGCSGRSSAAMTVSIRSSLMEQQTQPFARLMTPARTPATRSASMFMSPKSFTRTATRSPWAPWSIRFSSVVFPAPKKPVRTITGTGSDASCDPMWSTSRPTSSS